MKKEKMIQDIEEIIPVLTKKVRECKASDLERIKSLQRKRDTLMFAAFLIKIYPQNRINIYVKMFRKATALIKEQVAVQTKIF